MYIYIYPEHFYFQNYQRLYPIVYTYIYMVYYNIVCWFIYIGVQKTHEFRIRNSSYSPTIGLQDLPEIIQRLHAACTHQEMPRPHGVKFSLWTMSGFMVQGWARTKDGHFTSKSGRMGIINPLVFKTGDFGWKNRNSTIRNGKSINQWLIFWSRRHAQVFGIPSIWGWNPRKKS